jgi:hypothetical protein
MINGEDPKQLLFPQEIRGENWGLRKLVEGGFVMGRYWFGMDLNDSYLRRGGGGERECEEGL